MTTHLTGTREEWLAARLELLQAEKELTRRGDELALRRQALPWVRIDKEYRFEIDAGSASMADLFLGLSRLLIYHFMFGPDYTSGCPSYSAIADGFNGFVAHLASHDVTLSAVSRAPLAKLQAYRRRMGWTFPWASSPGGDFNFDFNVSITAEQQRDGGFDYNSAAEHSEDIGEGRLVDPARSDDAAECCAGRSVGRGRRKPEGAGRAARAGRRHLLARRRARTCLNRAATRRAPAARPRSGDSRSAARPARR
jgi:predicted dithiol-disulfide oxidoreductase (DUF899 family)